MRLLFAGHLLINQTFEACTTIVLSSIRNVYLSYLSGCGIDGKLSVLMAPSGSKKCAMNLPALIADSDNMTARISISFFMVMFLLLSAKFLFFRGF